MKRAIEIETVVINSMEHSRDEDGTDVMEFKATDCDGTVRNFVITHTAIRQLANHLAYEQFVQTWDALEAPNAGSAAA
jgi:hypothetical protein